MPIADPKSWYQFALQHTAAESFFGGVDIRDPDQVRARLRFGNNDPADPFIAKLIAATDPLPGFLRLTPEQADSFTSRYTVINQRPNDASGFSATLLLDRATGQYTLAFRSLEYRDADKGGDYERDSNGAALEIRNYGFALGQVASMEGYWTRLKGGLEGSSAGLLAFRDYMAGPNAKVNLTGYSLGGHLAQAFAKLHSQEVREGVVFNAAGLGKGQETSAAIGAMVADWQSKLAAAGLSQVPSSENIYDSSSYQQARAELAAQYSLTGQDGSPGIVDGELAAKVVQVYGHATHDDSEHVANSGRHGLSYPVFIEDQPDIEGLIGKTPIFEFATRNLNGDFGNTHSLTLLMDSLALMGLIQTIDPGIIDDGDGNFTLVKLNAILAAASNQRAAGLIGSPGVVEGDSLEKALDALRKIFSPVQYEEKGPLPFDRDGSLKNQSFANDANRSKFYGAISDVLTGVGSATYQVMPLTGTTYPGTTNGNSDALVMPIEPLDIRAAASAETGVAYRYALRELNPFAVLGVNYGTDPSLKLYDPNSAPGGMTFAYIEDRWQMLRRKTDIAVRSENNDVAQAVNLQPTSLSWSGDTVGYLDRATGYAVNQGNQLASEGRVIFGASRSDLLIGGTKTDRVYGSGQVDMLETGKGADYLEGGAGIDSYRFGTDDGADTVCDGDGRAVLVRNGKAITLGAKVSDGVWRFGLGTTLTRSQDGKDLEITFADLSTDKITLKDFDFAKAAQEGYLGIRLVDQLAAPAGATSEITGDRTPIDGSAEPGIQVQYDEWGNEQTAAPDVARADALYGHDDRGDRIRGGAEGDVIFGDTAAMALPAPRSGAVVNSVEGFADWLEGGAGRDIVEAGAGNDWVEGGADGDILGGQGGNDTLFADNSSNQLTTVDQAVGLGETGPDTPGLKDLIAGGAGDDVILSSAGADYLAGGEGKDLIVGAAGDDVIYGDRDVTAAPLDWSITRSVDESGTTAIYNVTPSQGFAESEGAGAADLIYGGAGADWIFAGGGADVVEAGTGENVVLGEAGSDVIFGGDQRDILDGDSFGANQNGSYGDDYLDGGGGDDSLFGGKGNDILIGGDGQDQLQGGDGDDLIYGGKDIDILQGGAGKDTYVYYKGDGEDVVIDPDMQAASQYLSSLVLGPGINRSDVKFRLGSLMVDVGGGDAIHFDGFNPDDPLATPVLESIQFADGETMSYAEVLAQGFDLDGTEGDDLIEGTAVTDRIDGKGGSDTLVGKAGNDAILGGEGNDDIDAGAGDDVVDAGAGHDIVDGGEGNDTLTSSGGGDFLYGGAGDDAFFAADGDTVIDTEGANTLDLTAYAGLTAENLEITQYETVDGEHYLNFHIRDDLNPGVTPATGGVSVERGEAGNFGAVTLGNGAEGTVTLTYAQLMGGHAAHGFVYKGSDAGTTLEGTPYADTMFGFAGEDTLNGGAGEDRLDGGQGDDTLAGGAGNDTYLLAFNNGRDNVIEDAAAEPGASHTIQLDAGIAASMVSARRVGDDLEVGLKASHDALVVKGYYAQPQAWQDAWSVRDSLGGTATVASLFPPPPPPAAEWLGEQKAAFRAQREQIYAANRQAEGFSAIGGNSFRQVEHTYAYSGSSASTSTNLRTLVVEQSSSDEAVQSAGAVYSVQTLDATGAAVILGQPQVRGLAQGRREASAGFGAAGTSGGGEGIFVPQSSDPGFSPQGRLSGMSLAVNPGDMVVPVYVQRTGVAKSVMRNAGGASYADAGGFQGGDWVIAGYRVYRAGSAAIGNEASVPGQRSSNLTNFTFDQTLTVTDLAAGASDNTITAADASVVEAGEGADSIQMSTGYFLAGPEWKSDLQLQGFRDPASHSEAQARYFAFESISTGPTNFRGRENLMGGFVDGGGGDDTVTGGSGLDSIVGGDGADALNGGSGSDRYFYAANEVGIDQLGDSGLDALSYVDRYYWSRHILNWDERLAHPGEWRVNFEGSNAYFAAQEDARAYIEGTTSGAGTLAFMAPLPEAAPLVTRNDGAQLDELCNSGMLDRDVVEFGPGLSLADLSLTIKVDPAAAAAHPEQRWHGGGVLEVRWGAAGFDVTVPDVSYGFVGTNLLTDGIPPELEVDPPQGSWRGYRLGEGVEEFRFADGSRFTLEQVLQQASVVEVLPAYHFFRGSGIQTVGRGHEGIVFEDAIRSFEVGMSRDGTDLILTVGADGLRIQGWYADPLNMPVTGLEFSLDAPTDAQTLTENGLVVFGTGNDEVLQGLDGFNDSIMAGAGNDVVETGSGDDYIEGGAGDDIVRGGAGLDDIEDWEGHNVLEGGAGDDYIYEEGSAFVIGGAGDDWIDHYGDIGGTVVAFNPGDGHDTVYPVAPLTLSIGGGITPADLNLSQDGTDLVLSVGANDSVRLSRQFEPDPAAWPQITLQMFGSVHLYDFNAVIDAFYAALAADPLLESFALDGVLQAHETSFSETDAMGGAIAWQYATTGTTGGLTHEQVRSVLGEAGFGATPQPIALGGANQAPAVANPIADQAATGDAAFSYTVAADAFADPDAGDTLTYSATLADGAALPAWLAFDAQTRTFSGTPAQADAGVLQVKVRAADAAGLFAEDTFNLDVASVNDAPEVSAPASQTVLLGQTVAASSLFTSSDADGDAPVSYELWDSTAGNGHFEVNGVEQGVNVAIAVSAADLANTVFIGAGAIGTDLVWARVSDGQSFGAWKSWTMGSAPHLGNAAPAVSASDATLLAGETVAAGALFETTDADGDPILQYELWDDVNGGGYWRLAGVQQAAAQGIALGAAELANAEYVGGAAGGTERVWARASDGMEWSAWKPWNITTALHIPNAAPVVTANASQTVVFNAAVEASALFSVTDADGDAITQYELWDSTAGNGHFTVNGVAQGVNVAISVSSADLQGTFFVGGTTFGTDQVWARANDGSTWGEWKSWSMGSAAHVGNAAPVVAAANATVAVDEVTGAATLFSVSDADADAILQYELWDDVAGGGYWRVNGAQQGAAQSIVVGASDLGGTFYVGGATGGTEQVWARASDGAQWSAWKPWSMTTALHIPNTAPVVSAPGSQTILLSDSVAAAGLFSVSDADGDAMTSYEFWDSTAGNGHFTVNGVERGVNVAIGVSSLEMANTQFTGSMSNGSDTVWVRANDGSAWSDWKSWTMQSAPHLTNGTPVASAQANGLLRNEAVFAGALFGVSDVDGDAVTQYEFWDDVNGGGYWRVNGVQQAAAQGIAVAAADLAGAEYVGGANAGTEQVWVRAHDGIAWGAWKNWLMSTEGGMFRGGSGPDVLSGDADTPILEGGAGNDTLTSGPSNSLLSGGTGDDTLAGGEGNDLLAGGAGNDSLSTGAGANVVAFNAGGGTDVVDSAAGASNTLSLGGGIDYDGLTLAKEGNDLVVNTGGDDHLVLKDWYAGKDTVANLQIILDATSAFDAASSDPLLNRKVQSFDFRAMVNEFDQARTQSPGLSSWAMTNALLQFHLSGSDGAAIGGDLAYWYGKNGSMAGIGLQSATEVLGGVGFGSDAQTLRPFNGLQEGFTKLG